MKNKYNMIVAADKNWCIGNKGDLLDKFPEDMKFFKAITTGKVVIMGKNTQESLPKKYLPNRINIVLNNTDVPNELDESSIDTSRTRIWYLKSADVIPLGINVFNHSQMYDANPAKFNYMTDGDVFVCGGGQIYKYFLLNDLIGTVYLTEIDHEYNGDTFIPNLYDLGFEVTDQLFPTFTNDNGIKYTIRVLKK